MAPPVTPTVAVALDAAEPELVRRLMRDGGMPVLADLAARGTWSTVTSSAHIGSASVWPTFGTGLEPHEHGMHYVWGWDPARMRIVRDDASLMVPWWRACAQDGRRVLTLDVPYLPFADVAGCTEVAEWGPHDRTSSSVRSRPPELAAEVAREFGRHPFQVRPAPPHDRPSVDYLMQMAGEAAEGARRRGRLAARLLAQHTPDVGLVVFTEVHRASHMLWQTVAPDDPLLRDRPHEGLSDTALVDVFRAADTGLGHILEKTTPDTRVLVFALHGMRSARGFPTLLDPLLVARGFAARPRAADVGLGTLGRAALVQAKSRAPDWARQLWRNCASPGMLNAVAEPTAMERHDWSRTRAFALPSDQHGWVRINLAGREAAGIVPESQYRATCDEVTAALLGARTHDGRPVVRRVLRMADDTGGLPPRGLPDLVVDWADAAHDDPVRIAGTQIEARPEGLRLTGKHAYEGFLLSVGVPPPGDRIASSALHSVITQ